MKTKQPSVLIPDWCNNPLAYYAIRSLKKASREFKINVIVSSSDQVSNDNCWLVFYKHSVYIDNLFISENEMGSEEYLDEVIRIIENTEIDIIFPASEEGFKFVSTRRDKLSSFCKVVALPSHDTLYTAFDKWSLYLFLKKHNIPMPKTVLFREMEQLSKFNYPVLLKPIDGSGGKNIEKLDSLVQESFQAILNNSKESYIVQEYIHGYDMGCSVLCWEGQVLAYTIQQQLGTDKGFAAKIDKLKFVHDSAVINIVTKTMNVLQWSGVANLDLRYNSKTRQLNVIEINPRFWQSMMGSLSAGVNFPYLLYLLSSGISLGDVSYQDKYYVKIQRLIRDVFNGSLEYSLSDTNIQIFLSDPNSVLQFIINKNLKNALPKKINNLFEQYVKK
jgi:D-aspartate ligase